MGAFWVALSAFGIAVFLGPVGQALGSYLESRRRMPAPLPGADPEETELRLAHLEAMEARVAELEERLDFAERMLARGLPAPGPEADTPPEPVTAAH